jgi:aspartokinase-like uncharacterized kinase
MLAQNASILLDRRKQGVLPQMARRVVKLGGSLLELPYVVGRLRTWIASQVPATTVLVVGGGRLADAIRDAQSLHGFSDSAAHWLCIRAMAIQAEMMRLLMPEAQLISTAAEVQCNLAPQLKIVDPWRFSCQPGPNPLISLPESWDVTSDSIAARVAEIIGADELVLLKSALPADSAIAAMSQAGYVDRFFPQAASALARIRFVNLREGRYPETLIAQHDTARR